tara:strand:+ start:1571 stop:2935 length:1365 start_codon:yes stop_codon:yes gene_type:complete
MIDRFHIYKSFTFLFFLFFLSTSNLVGNDLQGTNESEEVEAFIFTKDYGVKIDVNDYIDIINNAVINQPEFKASVAGKSSSKFNLNYARSDRLPNIISSLRNENVLDREVKDINSIRKIQDDSLDAIVEINQAIYSGGKLNAKVRSAKNIFESSSIALTESASILVLKANEIFLRAMNQGILVNYLTKRLSEIKDIIQSVEVRVQAGITQPEDLALVEMRYNNLSITLAQTKAELLSSQNAYQLFFRQPFNVNMVPIFPIVNHNNIDDNRKISYQEMIADYEYKESQEQIKIARSPYLPNFGFNIKYIRYDLNKEGDEFDLKGGVYFNMPIFTFGRGKNAVAAARSTSNQILWDKEAVTLEVSTQTTGMKKQLEGLIIARSNIIQSLLNSRKQEEILNSRMAVSNYSAVALSELISQEVATFSNLLTTEIQILNLDLQISHAETNLLERFRLKL